MDAKLVVVGGEARVTEIDLNLPVTIGRGRSTSIALPHPLVSRKHCEIYEEEGKLVINDLGSLNGTFVGDQRITEPTFLMPGELLTVGTVTFRAVYEIDGEVPAVEDDTTGTEQVQPSDRTVHIADQTISDIDPAEEVEAVEAVEDVEEFEDLEPVEEVAEEAEEVEAVEDADDAETDAVEVEDVAEEIAAEDVAEEVEEVEFAETQAVEAEDEGSGDATDADVDDLEEIEAIEEVEEVEEVGSEAFDADETIPVPVPTKPRANPKPAEKPAPKPAAQSAAKPAPKAPAPSVQVADEDEEEAIAVEDSGMFEPVEAGTAPAGKESQAGKETERADHDTKEVAGDTQSDDDDEDLAAFLKGLG